MAVILGGGRGPAAANDPFGPQRNERPNQLVTNRCRRPATSVTPARGGSAAPAARRREGHDRLDVVPPDGAGRRLAARARPGRRGRGAQGGPAWRQAKVPPEGVPGGTSRARRGARHDRRAGPGPLRTWSAASARDWPAGSATAWPERGIVERREQKVLGLFPRTLWPTVDSTHEEEVRRRLERRARPRAHSGPAHRGARLAAARHRPRRQGRGPRGRAEVHGEGAGQGDRRGRLGGSGRQGRRSTADHAAITAAVVGHDGHRPRAVA